MTIFCNATKYSHFAGSLFDKVSMFIAFVFQFNAQYVLGWQLKVAYEDDYSEERQYVSIYHPSSS